MLNSENETQRFVHNTIRSVAAEPRGPEGQLTPLFVEIGPSAYNGHKHVVSAVPCRVANRL